MSFCPFFSNGFTPLLSKTQVIMPEKGEIQFVVDGVNIKGEIMISKSK